MISVRAGTLNVERRNRTEFTKAAAALEAKIKAKPESGTNDKQYALILSALLASIKSPMAVLSLQFPLLAFGLADAFKELKSQVVGASNAVHVPRDWVASAASIQVGRTLIEGLMCSNMFISERRCHSESAIAYTGTNECMFKQSEIHLYCFSYQT